MARSPKCKSNRRRQRWLIRASGSGTQLSSASRDCIPSGQDPSTNDPPTSNPHSSDDDRDNGADNTVDDAATVGRTTSFTPKKGTF